MRSDARTAPPANLPLPSAVPAIRGIGGVVALLVLVLAVRGGRRRAPIGTAVRRG